MHIIFHMSPVYYHAIPYGEHLATTIIELKQKINMQENDKNVLSLKYFTKQIFMVYFSRAYKVKIMYK